MSVYPASRAGIAVPCLICHWAALQCSKPENGEVLKGRCRLTNPTHQPPLQTGCLIAFTLLNAVAGFISCDLDNIGDEASTVGLLSPQDLQKP
ncbi:hypothetical protein RRG08_048157 [Elysia crispata]|uniref:Uncharacterized protein n=1 Tax=Elysia crispata TaxID=231223 RepID=A0AAE0ZK37_9GAST|nr:hypothetical protein RRG08_048157 [Elysia crispata]